MPFPALLPSHTDRQGAGIDAEVEQRAKILLGVFWVQKYNRCNRLDRCELGQKPKPSSVLVPSRSQCRASGKRIRTCLRPEALLQHWRERLPLQLLNEICMTEGWKRGALLVWSRGVTWGRPCGLTVGGKGGQQGHSKLHKMLANSLRVEDSHASCLCG